MIPKWIETLAADFWGAAGYEEPFPRTLEQAVLLTKPVSITKLPRLSPLVIGEWFQQRRVVLPLAVPERWLNGCLITHRGMGFIFVEGSLAPDEVRMILAHEFAHYLAEYDTCRARTVRRLGQSILPILDGHREPTLGEQLGAALAGVELRAHVHYMERTARGTYSKATSKVEQTANDLALELIAPWRAVLCQLQADGQLSVDPLCWHEVLQRQFGVPESWAVPYARQLKVYAQRNRTFSQIMGF